MSASAPEAGERPSGWSRETSPYHAGEHAVQERAGARAFAERNGRQVIRDYMTEQHRTFFAGLRYVFAGSLDERGRPWASVLTGSPGFTDSPEPRTLTVSAPPSPADPARSGFRLDAPIGIVGVELHTRRRNRLTGRIRALTEAGFTLAVDQSFGNCPQYIQRREPIPDAHPAEPPPREDMGALLTARALEIVSRADTFFIASASAHAGSDDPVEGVDINHRGGKPGFVRLDRVDGATVLTVPDFVGNLAFNTFGNIAVNPVAGLLFPDFDSGDVVSLTGRAEVIWEGEELKAFLGAERLLRVTVEQAFLLPAALPWRWSDAAPAPQNDGTGDWQAVSAALRAGAQLQAERPYRVVRIEQESPSVRSFYLEPADGLGLAGYEPGQFLPIKILPDGAGSALHRAYSLSQAADGRAYRLSIRRIAQTASANSSVSAWFHDTVRVGTQITARAPAGAFHLDPDSRRPVVLIAGGIGITPLLAMAQHLTGGTEGRQRYPDRPVVLLHALRNGADHPFRDTILALGNRANLTVAFAYSAPRAEDRPGIDYHIAGRLDRAVLRALLPLDDHDYYLCGPQGFMQTVYDALISLGAPDRRIHSEAFGPSALRRPPSDPAPDIAPPVPGHTGARVQFLRSGKQAVWPGGQSLLDLAESASVDVPWSCRSGRCGSCAVPVRGRVAYAAPPQFPIDAGLALLCCAVPADSDLAIDI